MAESVEHESESMSTELVPHESKSTALVPYESNSSAADLLPNDESHSIVGNGGLVEAYAKRASVGVTGGIITAVGLVMIPAPTPGGCVVAAYGISLLATEFDGVSEAMENGKRRLEGNLASLAGKLQDNMKLHDERFHQNVDNHLGKQDEGEEGAQSPAVGVKEVAEEESEEEESEEEGKYSEFQAVLTGKQTVVDKAKGIWSVHTKNMRRVSLHVIEEVFLPALKNIRFSNPGGSKDEGDESQTTESTGDEADSEVLGSEDGSVDSNTTTDGANSTQAEPQVTKEEAEQMSRDEVISLHSESMSLQAEPLGRKEEKSFSSLEDPEEEIEGLLDIGTKVEVLEVMYSPDQVDRVLRKLHIQGGRQKTRGI